MSSSRLTQMLGKARRHADKLAARIAEAHAAGRYHKAEALQREYVGSYDARLVATAEAARRMARDYRPTEAAIIAAAAKLNLWQPSREPVEVFLVPKKTDNGNNDYRPVCRFGLDNRALQRLLVKAISPRVSLLPNQYGTKGVTPAVEAARATIEAGNRYVATLDIESFYPSIARDLLREVFPGPERWIDTVVLARNLNFVPRWGHHHIYSLKHQLQEVEKLKKELAALTVKEPCKSSEDSEESIPKSLHSTPDACGIPHAIYDPLTADYLAEARQGIPDGGIAQGSACSSLVAEILLRSVIEQLPNLGVVVNFADDFALFASSGEELALMSKALRSAFEAHPAARFRVKQTIYRPGETIPFLGYTLSPTSDHVAITPQMKNLKKFQGEFRRRVKKIKAKTSPIKRRKLIRLHRQYVRSWHASFPLWNEGSAHRDKYLDRIKQLKNGNP